MDRLPPDLKPRTCLIAVVWEHMSWTRSASFALCDIWSLSFHCNRRRRHPCDSSTRTKVPTACPTLTCVNVFTKSVSWLQPLDTSHTVISGQSRQSPVYMFCKDMYRRASTFTDRGAFVVVTIYHAVFEDVLCPHLNALHSIRNGVESKTSLRKSCCYIQREASGPDNPHRCHHLGNIARPFCCPD